MKILTASLLCLFAAACASTSPRYQVRVGNNHPSLPVRDVKLTVDGVEQPGFTQIAPQKVANAKPHSGAPPQKIEVSWTNTEGKQVRQLIETDGVLSKDFRGEIALAITPENRVTLIPVPAVGKEFSPIPWGVPEQWEGSVFLPGMNE